ncbi:peroxiredoxin [Novosphingobium sp. YJ-S2-02]|uniref:thioredoxin-dependent peroxiredoxin n=1 Tax=Novosphingobium aureum TaxID=2792964 RepID=A0A931HCM7_9SPHN|nr:peroxiredoxin [Novosphingobium aureum]MBH0113506.1 peroxiredoxin [Novosphingobium aureum]
MRKSLISFAALGLFLLPGVSQAALPVGAKAPTFATKGAKAGKEVSFDLRKALARGPVVLYFYPKAFTQGCTLEAHAFAEATDEFASYGATVIGMSADDLPTLKKFSTEECRDKFTVGIASPKITKEYDVGLDHPKAAPGMTARVSYVIGQDGKIVMVHSDLDYREHVSKTLAAVRKLAK